MTQLQGADPAVVRRAIETGDPLPGTGGFAGQLDGWLVRDVLGRYPLFSEADDPSRWSTDPTTLEDPIPVRAGHRRSIEDAATGADAGAAVDERLWSLPDPDPFEDDDRAVAAVREAVVQSIDAVGSDAVATEAKATETGITAIAFSGGLDSGLLAARLDGPLYVGGFPGGRDVEAATAGAAALGRDLEVVEFTHADLERAVPEVVEATGRSNAMDVAIALPLYLVAERVAADGHDRLVLGQGADELFGGYAKVAKAPEDPRLESATVRGATREVVATLPDQLERDVLAVRAAGVEPVVPLLHDRVVAAALRLPEHLLVGADGDAGAGGGQADRADGRKVALREAADFVPDELRYREKTAVQYGSLVSRELDRLARQAGYKRRMDDHVGRYVESLLE